MQRDLPFRHYYSAIVNRFSWGSKKAKLTDLGHRLLTGLGHLMQIDGMLIQTLSARKYDSVCGKATTDSYEANLSTHRGSPH